MSTTDPLDARLTELRGLNYRIEQTQTELRGLRLRRDDAIRAAVRAGASERQAASAASVSPSYAHRAARAGRFAGLKM